LTGGREAREAPEPNFKLVDLLFESASWFVSTPRFGNPNTPLLLVPADLICESTLYLPGPLAFDSGPSELLTYFVSLVIPEDFRFLFSRLPDLIFKSTPLTIWLIL
jgi:hypothetical protein